jgi:pilus assembly protein CpaE
MDQSTLITFVGIVDFIPTIKNMKIGYDTMRSIGYEKNRIRFILNRSDSKTSIALEDVEQLLEERFYHVLPNNFAAAMGSIDRGLPLVLDREMTVLGRSLQELVTKYTTGMSVAAGGNKSVKSWVRRLLK